MPPTFGRFVGLGNQRFVPIEDVIGEHLKKLFPGMEVLGAHTFRVTRNEDLEVEEDDAENLLKALEKELLRRRFGAPVRLEVEESIDPKVLDLLVSELGVGRDEVVSLPGPLDLTGLHSIADLPRDDLKYAAFLPSTHPSLAEVESASPVDVFDSVARHDVLLHHPYDSFATSVQRFLEQAAADPHVLAIKQTLYRTSGDSPIIEALIDAAAGRQAGAGDRRDQGALRRAGQHPLGPQARARRLPRGLRPRRPQDPLQALDGRARRARGHPALRPPRHRQLQPQDRPRSTRTSACSPPTPRSARTSRCSSTTCPGSAATRRTTTCWSPRTTSATA